MTQTLEGIAATSQDEGARGFGRHAQVIRLGRQLWSTGPLSDEEIDVLDICEAMFDDGQYPPAEEAKQLLAACAAASAEVQAPFSGQTDPHASSTIEDYEQR